MSCTAVAPNIELSIDESLRLGGLEEQAGTRLDRLSGGQRQRLFFAVAVTDDPDDLFPGRAHRSHGRGGPPYLPGRYRPPAEGARYGVGRERQRVPRDAHTGVSPSPGVGHHLGKPPAACLDRRYATGRRANFREEAVTGVEDAIAPLAEVFRLQGDDELREAERRYLSRT